MDALRIHTGTEDKFLVSESHLPLERQVLPTLLLLALVSFSGFMPAVVAKDSNNTCVEIQVLQGIPDTTAMMGKVFYYSVPPFAFQGKITHYKFTLASGAELPKWLEYNPNTTTLQGLPVNEKSGEYHLNVAAYGDVCIQKTPTANVNFILLVQESILIPEKMTGLSHMPKGNIISSERCTRTGSVTSAEIIIHAAAESLDVQERLYLVCTMAEYLHLDPTSLALNPYQGLVHRSRWNLTVLAEDTSHINFLESHYIGLYWPVGCGIFAMLSELVQVLRHNVDSHRLSQLLGYEIAGWRIIKREGFERQHSGRQPRQLMFTPTPTLKVTEIIAKPTEEEVFTTLPPKSLFYLHTETVVSSMQSWLFFHELSTAITNYNDLIPHFETSQQSSGALEIDPSWNFPSKRAMSSTIFQERSAFAFPELSPSLISTATSLSIELKGLQNTVSSMPLLLEQPQSHKLELDPFLQSSKSEPLQHHFLSVLSFDITEATGKGQFSRPIYTLMTETHYEWPLIWPEVSPSSALQTCFLEEILTSVYSHPKDSISDYDHFPEYGMPSSTTTSPEKLPSTPTSTSLHLALFDFTPSIDDMFLLLSGSSHLSQEVFNGFEYMSKSFMSIPQTDRLPFTEEEISDSSIIHIGTAIWDRTSNPSSVTSILDSSILSSTFPSDAGTAQETSLTAQSYPNNAPLLSLPTDFAGFQSSELSRPMKIFDSYDRSKLRTYNHFPSILPSGTKVLNPDRSLVTRIILPNTTVFTLEPIKVSNIPSYTAETSMRTMFNAASHLHNGQELVQMPSSLVYQDTSTLPIPTYEALQSTEVAWVHLLFSVSQVLHDITPGQTNTSPEVVNSIKLITATIGCKFDFSVPADTFYDQEDGNTTQLTLRINPVDGSPSGPESWLQFNASLQTMSGYPLNIDFQYSPQEFVLSATDSGGLTAWEPLTIELLRPISVPCHIYTIRTKNRICLPTPEPFNGSLILNSTFPTYNEENNCRIKNALLISLCATIVMTLIIVAHRCYKYHKILESQSMTFHGRPPGYGDLEMGMLKPRKAPVLQREVSPSSPQLWIPVLPSSQQHTCRPSVRLPQSLPPFQPPRYQLPPLYEADITSQSDQGNIHRRDYPKSRLH
nr:uncharacterized protein LOC102452653 [Pelodiscus sinensis]|eukprot:XP_014431248.1 uncharacterized protein LOC102452653 [Pelodiscus sinensis]